MILWSKLRRSRGFGIHSPFAFDLVLNTLRSRDRYYAYSEIPTLIEAARQAGTPDCPSESLLRLVVRLIARLKPLRLRIIGDSSGLIEQVIRLADSRIDTAAGNPVMVILTGRGTADADVRTAVDTVTSGGVAFLLDRRKAPQAAAAITSAMSRGMTFRSRHKLLAVGARHLPRQDFEIAY